MKIKVLVTFLIIILLLPSIGGIGEVFSQPVQQEWVRRYPDSLGGWGVGNAITTDNKGSVYVTGEVIQNNHPNICAIKYKTQGDVGWMNLWAGNSSGGRSGNAIAVDKSLNVIVIGSTISNYNNADYIVIKYDSTGNQKWVREYNGIANDEDVAYALVIDEAGNVYVTGHISMGGNAFVYGTIKYNSNGDSLWERNYGVPSSSSQPFAMAIDEHCNIYITGMNNNSAATVSYDSSGNLRWSNTYPMSWGYSIALDQEDNVFIAGAVADSAINGNDYLTIKYSSNGVQQWVRKYTDCNQWGCGGLAKAIVVDKNGNIYINGGFTASFDGITTIKYNTFGDSVWVRKYSSIGNFYSQSMIIDSLNNIYIATVSPDTIPNGRGGYLTIKYDSSGILGWAIFYTVNCQYFGSSSYAITTDNIGKVYVTGGSETPNCFNWWDMTTIKYSQPLFGIKKIGNNIPESYKLYQNYPNPFNSSSKIKFQISKSGNIKLKVFDILGRELEMLASEKLSPGIYETEFNDMNFASGVYFYQLIVNNKIIDTKKLVLLK